MPADLLIIGAGPYGLATAVQARAQGLEVIIVGYPMELWRRNMPAGMVLRSGLDWHLDPLERDTLTAFAEERRISSEHMHPLALERFLDYAEWFQDRQGLEPRPEYVRALRRTEAGFEATMAGGDRLLAKQVVVAAGFAPFTYVPDELRALVPGEYASHTCHTVDMAAFAGRRCLIVGGRQSAYEWAALLREAGARQVHLVHRHPTPEFAESDWSWVYSLVLRTEREPGWFRGMSTSDQEALQHRFWIEGRSKLEPWLTPRLADDRVRRWPGASLAGCEPGADGALAITLTTGERLIVDHVIFATGYRVHVTALDYLDAGGLLSELRIKDGYPALDPSFQSSIPGLYFTGLPATRDFGPFFGFMAGCRVTARMVVGSIAS